MSVDNAPPLVSISTILYCVLLYLPISYNMSNVSSTVYSALSARW